MAISGKRIVISGGGTGGHITPLVSVASLLKLDNQLLWIADATPLAQQAAADLGIGYVTIPAAKVHRFWTLKNLSVPWHVFRGVMAAKQALQRFQPDVVFAKGGYASLPVVMAASDLRIPVVIHESDAIMGWANRMAAHYAVRVCTSFPVKDYPAVPGHKLIETGLPIAPQFFATKAVTTKKPHLLVTGGSQGARGINEVIREALPELLKTWTVEHIVGRNDFAAYEPLQSDTYRVYEFVDPSKMAQLIAASRVVVARASATTFSEVAAVGRPIIVVPLPLGANGHQHRNAELWQKARAAVAIDQTDLTAQRLVQAIADAEKYVSIEAMKKFVHKDAAKRIIDVLGEAV